ncbi:hypothetical protein N7532_001427 [Penicillium argentinense]|uniref:Uncharacterized protein n=1 Tax=Penicillium argentinense TaxID=1131581 RepID=A0A9W9G2K7_9EURO|nr:uncharacterized protein N7532_001427 [Penicillium argentinense]KAJ5110892.1 hypothetical protein N7532_001427 [Penicillium argentinense]
MGGRFSTGGLKVLARKHLSATEIALPRFTELELDPTKYMTKSVEKVLTTKTRGNQKVEIMKNGILCEEWRFSRQHVEDIRGIGWKVEDDDEVGIDPLSFIQPVPHSVYSQTQALVKWKMASSPWRAGNSSDVSRTVPLFKETR